MEVKDGRNTPRGILFPLTGEKNHKSLINCGYQWALKK
jgi:hypothetical protein